MRFAESDAYKWLEAASYALANEYDLELAEHIDEVVEFVAAQADDGYLNTCIKEPDRRWANLARCTSCTARDTCSAYCRPLQCHQE